MVVQLRGTSPPLEVPLAKWIAVWPAASSQVEGAPTEAEAQAEAVKAW